MEEIGADLRRGPRGARLGRIGGAVRRPARHRARHHQRLPGHRVDRLRRPVVGVGRHHRGAGRDRARSRGRDPGRARLQLPDRPRSPATRARSTPPPASCSTRIEGWEEEEVRRSTLRRQSPCSGRSRRAQRVTGVDASALRRPARHERHAARRRRAGAAHHLHGGGAAARSRTCRSTCPASSTPIPTSRATSNPFKVTVATAGEYHIDEQQYDLEGVIEYLAHAARRRPRSTARPARRREAQVRADPRVHGAGAADRVSRA